MKLTPNCAKIVEAILFLLEEGKVRDIELSQYDIVKSLFEADTAHLNEYGRPITFDNYFALQHGPVARESYEMLKLDYNWAELGFDAAPWSARDIGPTTRCYTARRKPDLRLLSKSDQKALAKGLELVISLGFKGERKRTHEHPAWVKAWSERGGKKSNRMDYALLFNEPDQEAAEELAYISARA